MCGIVGYVGVRACTPIIIDGLKRLEYRGYDSAGVAVVQGGGIRIVRSEGKLVNLEDKLRGDMPTGVVGIGHTRWATHGKPCEANAHPHCMEDIAVVHNGIIENYVALRAELTSKGYAFTSETDTEVVPHLIHSFTRGGMGLEDAFRATLKRLEGSYALAVVSSLEPGRLYAARKASPLVIGLGENENLVASDVPALLSQTRRMVFLEDGDIVVLEGSGVRITDSAGMSVERAVSRIDWTPAMAEKGGYKHFMLKEIFEQPRAVADTLAGRYDPLKGEIELEDFAKAREIAKELKALHIVACGTSFHAALAARYWFERLAKIPVTIDLASEYRYRDPLIMSGTGLLLISQSGETADTLAAMDLGKKLGAPAFGVCNVVGSSLARSSDAILYTHAGPEIGVASTKAFTTQLATLYVMALYFARARGTLTATDAAARIGALLTVPRLIEEVLETEKQCREVAQRIVESKSAIFLGRGLQYPVALEGALKLKEISYIHAEGYAAGEMKHGPIALIDEHMPVIALMPQDPTYDKMASNIQEVMARNARVFAVATAGDENARKFERVISVPACDPDITPIITTVPLQLLAYHVAVLKGTDVDQPRNLAKSVTVE